MSRDSVRYGRVPKRTKEAVSTDSMPDLARNLTVSGAVPLANKEDMESESVRHDVSRELTKTVTAAHRCNNTYTEELRGSLPRRAILLQIDDSDNEGSGGEEAASSTTDRATDVRSVLWHHVALRMTPAVQQVVEFAKRLPGFHNLPQDDQLILIKLGFFEVWLTRATRLSSADGIVFDDGTIITHSQLEIVYDVITAASTGTGAGGTAPARLAAMAAATRDVQTLGRRHLELLAWCRDHWPRLVLPALFAEIFDIPKGEEDDAADTERACSSSAPPPSSSDAAAGTAAAATATSSGVRMV
ncbi:hypothetical protein MSG28_000755 [Choristoneura fumiferana]|uniref:Uncharacterized protein n=1 Tax=Choristoneura fumiferana TaxID=7141 RepID=A0ACC0K232_CHOFU|nr:hypothetical protein MSG28_000755 [Choristoneura fumiferana]